MRLMRTPKLIVAKDGSETWKVRFRLDGRQSSQTFPTLKAADRFAGWINQYGAVRALDLLTQMLGAVKVEQSVADWCREYVANLSGVTDGTTRRYRSYIDNDFGEMGELPLSALTADSVAAWIRRMTAAGASGKTMANKHGFLSAAIKKAVKADLIPKDPCAGTQIPKTVTEPMVFLTYDEYVRFLGCFTSYWQPMIEVMFGTGLRWGEITALRVGDLDLDQSSLHVVRAWKEGDGVPVLGPPKSRKSRRTIDLAPETITVLRQAIADRAGDEYVFVNHAGNPVRSGTFHNNVWQPAVRLANGEAPGSSRPRKLRNAAGEPIKPLDPSLGKRPRIHDARHTCASWLLASGIPINYVQAHLGHESITTTVDRYGHIMPAKRQAISQALSAALTASRPQLVSAL